MRKNSFHLVLLPHEPLIGVGLINSHTVGENEQIYNLYGLEIGLLFFRFSFMRIGSPVS